MKGWVHMIARLFGGAQMAFSWDSAISGWDGVSGSLWRRAMGLYTS